MQVVRIHIENFRGVKGSTLNLAKHAVLLGDNNTGKTTVLEALDLVLVTDRLNRTPPIDEHDFYHGKYATKSKKPAPKDQKEKETNEIGAESADAVVLKANESPEGTTESQALQIRIDVTIIDLSEEQRNRFGDYVEFWDNEQKKLYQEAAPEGVDAEKISHALRVTFIGKYDEEEDDFEGKTFYTITLAEGRNSEAFSKKDKQVCGFLYLRSVRTGSRALSLERGSLLDIILRLKELAPNVGRRYRETLCLLSCGRPEPRHIGSLAKHQQCIEEVCPEGMGC